VNKIRYIALIREDKRDNFRRIAFRWTTPSCAPRANSGSVSLKASAAADLSPDEIAVSTDLTKVRTLARHAPLIALRLVLRRIRFTADW